MAIQALPHATTRDRFIGLGLSTFLLIHCGDDADNAAAETTGTTDTDGQDSGDDGGDGDGDGDGDGLDCEDDEIEIDGECEDDPCADDPCGIEDGHGKSCTPDDDDVGVYECRCDDGFDPDDDCQSCPEGSVEEDGKCSEDPCAEADCGDHGSCITSGDDAGSCACDEGWKGEDCDEAIPEPTITGLALDCSNHAGLCMAGGEDYTARFVTSDAEDCEVDDPRLSSGSGDPGKVEPASEDMAGEWSFAYQSGSDTASEIAITVQCRGPGGTAEAELSFRLGSDPNMDPPPEGIELAGVGINQGVSIKLIEGDTVLTAGDRNAPVIGGRAGLLRAFWAIDDDWRSQSVLARLYWRTDEGVESFDSIVEIDDASDEGRLKGTFNWKLDAEQISDDVNYAVVLYAAEQRADSVASIPAQRKPSLGWAELSSDDAPARMHVVIVPVRHRSSGCTTDTTELLDDELTDGLSMLDLYRREIFTRNPVQEIELTVRDTAVDYNNIDDWMGLLRTLQTTRTNDGADPSSYYYAAWDTCRANPQGAGGYSLFGENAANRVSAGRFYVAQQSSIDFSMVTFVHELGHAQGRRHTPCGGPVGTDPNYPYPNAEIGKWGYDLELDLLKHPKDVKDYMSYCYQPSWNADYGWRLQHARAKMLSRFAPGEQRPSADSAWSARRILTATLATTGEVYDWRAVQGSFAEPARASSGHTLQYWAGEDLVLEVPARISPVSEGDAQLLSAPLPRSRAGVTRIVHRSARGEWSLARMPTW